MNKVVYLAAPFTSDDKLVEDARYQAVQNAAYFLLGTRYTPVSPVMQWYPLYKEGRELKYEDLLEFGEKVLSKCDMVFVLTLPGWEDSVGVSKEIELARDLDIPVLYVNEKELIKLVSLEVSVNG